MQHNKCQHSKLHLVCLGVLVLAIFFFLNQEPVAQKQPIVQEKSLEEQIQEANYCEVAQDCAVLEGKCPFGCYITVNKAEVENLKPALDKYETRCMYSCIQLEGVVCQNKKCAPVAGGDVLRPSGEPE